MCVFVSQFSFNLKSYVGMVDIIDIAKTSDAWNTKNTIKYINVNIMLSLKIECVTRENSCAI